MEVPETNRKVRFGFLPSDFHPMLLMLGEREGLLKLSDLLRSFAQEPRNIRFSDVEFLFTPDLTAVLLTTHGKQQGMRLVSNLGHPALEWTLEPWQAEDFSEQVADLARPMNKSGSADLEAAPGEVRVKVSLGEFTDDFLTVAG